MTLKLNHHRVLSLTAIFLVIIVVIVVTSSSSVLGATEPSVSSSSQHDHDQHSGSHSSSSSSQQHHPNNDDIHRHHQGHQTTVNNDNEHHKKLYHQHHQGQNQHTIARVLELSDRFLEIVNNAVPAPPATNPGDVVEPKYQPWLVMFYAPWCGHCKRLEPVFNHVAQALHNTPIRVGRVDCTRFPAVGGEFKIHGYPTIMFISGPKRKHVFQGDRDVVQIVRFAKRMSSPPVTLSPLPLQTFIDKHTHHLRKSQSQEENPARVKRNYDHHSPTTTAIEESTDKEIFFGIVKPPGYRDELTQAFVTVATKYQQHNEFYEFNEGNDGKVVLFAYKHGRILVFDGSPRLHENMTELVETWVGNERFPDFMHLTRSNLFQVFSEGHDPGAPNLKELIVVAVVEEDKLERVVNDHEKRLLQTLQQVTHNAVQTSLLEAGDALSILFPELRVPVTSTPLAHHFSWIGSPDLANSIVAEHLPLPTLLIIQKSPLDMNHKYYVFSDASVMDTEAKVENLVELVREGHFQPTVNANSFSFKLYRYMFDAKVSFSDMWRGNPVLTIVLFGLPLGFLSLILYSVCCGDILDAKEEDDIVIGPEDSDDEDAAAAAAAHAHAHHQKRE